MSRPLIVFAVIVVLWEVLVGLATIYLHPVLGIFIQLALVGWIAMLVVTNSIGLVQAYEQIYVLRLGQKAGVRDAGFFFVLWPMEVARRVNTQIYTSDLSETSVLTSDAVPVSFIPSFRVQVINAEAAALNVRDYLEATNDSVQGAVQHIVGDNPVAYLLQSRVELNTLILKEIDDQTEEFGIRVSAIQFRGLRVPAKILDELSVAATARRSAEAQIIEAEAELNSAKNLAEAAEILNGQPGAFDLRTYQMIEKVGEHPSSTILFPYNITSRQAALALLANGKPNAQGEETFGRGDESFDPIFRRQGGSDLPESLDEETDVREED